MILQNTIDRLQGERSKRREALAAKAKAKQVDIPSPEERRWAQQKEQQRQDVIIAEGNKFGTEWARNDSTLDQLRLANKAHSTTRFPDFRKASRAAGMTLPLKNWFKPNDGELFAMGCLQGAAGIHGLLQKDNPDIMEAIQL